MSSIESAIETLGSWDEAGLVRNLHRMGFTKANCINELIGNSIDAKATKILFRLSDDKEYILFIDNGNGMNRSDIRKMTNIFSENHSNREKIGVSGLGFKPSTKILSDNRHTIVLTREDDGEYLKVYFPWDKITEEKKYTGNVWEYVMTDTENDTFDCLISSLISSEEKKHGTIVKIPFTHEVWDIIQSFTKFDTKIMPPKDRPNVVYGLCNVEIRVITADGSVTKLPMYNPLPPRSADGYYPDLPRKIETFHIYQHNDGKSLIRFIHIDKETKLESEFGPGRGGYSRSLSTLSSDKSLVDEGYSKIPQTTMTLHIGIPYDDKLTADSMGKDFHGPMERECFGEDGCENTRIFRHTIRVFRNDMYIGSVNPEKYLDESNRERGTGLSSMRGNPASATLARTICELRYRTSSNQDNPLDNAFGVQGNKSQNTGDIPNGLSRHITYFRERYATRAYEILNRQFTTPSLVESDVVAVRESESESEASESNVAVTPVVAESVKSESELESESESESESEASESNVAVTPVVAESVKSESELESELESESEASESNVAVAPVVAEPVAEPVVRESESESESESEASESNVAVEPVVDEQVVRESESEASESNVAVEPVVVEPVVAEPVIVTEDEIVNVIIPTIQEKIEIILKRYVNLPTEIVDLLRHITDRDIEDSINRLYDYHHTE
jgi:hypothetical protein